MHIKIFRQQHHPCRVQENNKATSTKYRNILGFSQSNKSFIFQGKNISSMIYRKPLSSPLNERVTWETAKTDECVNHFQIEKCHYSGKNVWNKGIPNEPLLFYHQILLNPSVIAQAHTSHRFRIIVNKIRFKFIL